MENVKCNSICGISSNPTNENVSSNAISYGNMGSLPNIPIIAYPMPSWNSNMTNMPCHQVVSNNNNNNNISVMYIPLQSLPITLNNRPISTPINSYINMYPKIEPSPIVFVFDHNNHNNNINNINKQVNNFNVMSSSPQIMSPINIIPDTNGMVLIQANHIDMNGNNHNISIDKNNNNNSDSNSNSNNNNTPVVIVPKNEPVEFPPCNNMDQYYHDNKIEYNDMNQSHDSNNNSIHNESNDSNDNNNNNDENNNIDDEEIDVKNVDINRFYIPNGNGDKKPWKCKIGTCNRKFQHKSNLKIHLKIHTPNALKCNYCSKRFARKPNLIEHIRIHTGESPFKCNFCLRGFKQKHSLEDHVRVHTGEKPYECQVCQKCFAVKNNLEAHRRVHMSIDE